MFKTLKALRLGASELIEKHPKLTKFYRSGLGKRWLMLLFAIPMIAIPLGVFYAVGYSFVDRNLAMSLVTILLELGSIALFGNYLFVFFNIGYQTLKMGLKHRAGQLIDKITDNDEKEDKTKDTKQQELKPHNIFDAFFSAVLLVFFVALVIGAILIPIMTASGQLAF